MLGTTETQRKIGMNPPRKIPFIATYSCESSESDNDIEPRARFLRNASYKKSVARGASPSPVATNFIPSVSFSRTFSKTS